MSLCQYFIFPDVVEARCKRRSTVPQAVSSHWPSVERTICTVTRIKRQLQCIFLRQVFPSFGLWMHAVMRRWNPYEKHVKAQIVRLQQKILDPIDNKWKPFHEPLRFPGMRWSGGGTRVCRPLAQDFLEGRPRSLRLGLAESWCGAFCQTIPVLATRALNGPSWSACKALTSVVWGPYKKSPIQPVQSPCKDSMRDLEMAL